VHEAYDFGYGPSECGILVFSGGATTCSLVLGCSFSVNYQMWINFRSSGPWPI